MLKDFSNKSPGVYLDETEVLKPEEWRDFSYGEHDDSSGHDTSEPIFVKMRYFLESEDNKAIITEDGRRILIRW